jgi:hypothetical protein
VHPVRAAIKSVEATTNNTQRTLKARPAVMLAGWRFSMAPPRTGLVVDGNIFSFCHELKNDGNIS